MGGNTNNKIIIIVGPTASGKSDLALRLAKLAKGKAFKKKNINGSEIISADSRQVYRGMDLGTGKVLRDKTLPVPRLKVLLNKDFYSREIRHHLIDVASPKKRFTADDFRKLGRKSLSDIARRSKLPIIVGGTGFYIDVLLGRMKIAEVPPNKKLRTKLEKQSAERLYSRLSSIDYRRAQKVDRHNKHRLIRAIEISHASKATSFMPKTYNLQPITYNILWLGINPGKEKLAKKIKKRLDARLEQGMIEEVKRLHGQGVSWKRLDDLGLEYRWISRWLKSKKLKVKSQNFNSKFKSSEEYKNLLRDIIKYSKRQMTWFKRNKEIRWIKNLKEAEKHYASFVS